MKVYYYYIFGWKHTLSVISVKVYCIYILSRINSGNFSVSISSTWWHEYEFEVKPFYNGMDGFKWVCQVKTIALSIALLLQQFKYVIFFVVL